MPTFLKSSRLFPVLRKKKKRKRGKYREEEILKRLLFGV
jgi:hypothetical protein